MSKDLPASAPIAEDREGGVTRRSYIIGFVSSLALTLTAYILAEAHLNHGALTHRAILTVIAGLAVVQFIVQLLFFLHLGRERRPRWKFLVFWGMLLVVGILVIGSLWIMHSLNYRMTPEQMLKYMNSQDGL
jgi:cytochrome o ubiquinol oxidase operon protein cyoD